MARIGPAVDGCDVEALGLWIWRGGWSHDRYPPHFLQLFIKPSVQRRAKNKTGGHFYPKY